MKLPPGMEDESAARRVQREAARREAHRRGETSALRVPAEGLSTPGIVRAVIAKIREIAPELRGEYLDIGAGNGELIDRIVREFPLQARACDYRDDLMTLGRVSVDVVDLNSGRVPYENDSFDLVTCTEVIEHLEHHRPLVREIYRILRPRGVCVLSTPNVLNLRSRLRYLFFGFFNMFGPLLLGDDRHHSTHGHINPVAYFYLAHSLSDAGFQDISVSVDKRQRRSWFALVLLWLPIRIFTAGSVWKERHKYRTLGERNEGFVREMNSVELLLGRTVVIGCRKP